MYLIYRCTLTCFDPLAYFLHSIELGGAHPSSTDELNKLVERVCEFELQSFTDASTKVCFVSSHGRIFELTFIHQDDYRLAVAREIMHMRANATN